MGETLRAALNSLAMVAPAWLQAMAPPEWYDRFGRRVENDDLPKTEAARQELATVSGTAGTILLDALDAATEPRWLREIPAVHTLRQVWAEPYVNVEGALVWREVKAMPSPAEFLASPDDPEARDCTKRRVEWVGYQVPRTETCEEDTPPLIVNVEPTPATSPDDHLVAVVHGSLAPQDLLPAEHVVDKGSTDSHVLVDSRRDDEVTSVGPVADDPSWQARAGQGFDQAQVLVDGERQVVPCPVGKQSLSWLPNTSPQNGMRWEVRFARKDGTPYVQRSHGPRRRERRVSWDGKHATSTKPCKPHDNGRRPRYFDVSMPPARVSKAPTSKPSDAVADGDVAQLATPKPMCSTSSPLRRSISCGWQHGLRECLGPQHGSPPWRHSRRRRVEDVQGEFATSVNISVTNRNVAMDGRDW